MTAQPRLPLPYLDLSGASFLDFARTVAPETLTLRVGEPGGAAALPEQAHATTVVALVYAEGVVMAGDRRATTGSMIVHREIEKVFPADDSAVVGIAGTAGVGLELVRLFQLELEHYEKIVGAPLSLEGKANRLATLVRANLHLALQGLLALPLLAGLDRAAPPSNPGTGSERDQAVAQPRLYSFDAVGGRYAERDHHAIGSGAVFARGTLKNRWRRGLSRQEAVALALAALLDAADDDAATAGVDLERGIYPLVTVVDATGCQRAGDDELAAQVATLHGRRRAEQGET